MHTDHPENLCIAKLRSKMNYWLKISTVLFVEEIKENNKGCRLFFTNPSSSTSNLRYKSRRRHTVGVLEVGGHVHMHVCGWIDTYMDM